MASKPKWMQCIRFGKMTAKKKNQLPNSAFGLPQSREYPMPDPAHAKNAKSRASREYNAKRITRKERDRVYRKADRVIKACGGGSRGLKGRPPWSRSETKKYSSLVRSCSLRKKCSKKRGKAKVDCTRSCKSAASRTVNRS